MQRVKRANSVENTNLDLSETATEWTMWSAYRRPNSWKPLTEWRADEWFPISLDAVDFPVYFELLNGKHVNF